ncbi:hypothetical protein GHT09_019833 [Marmota monax]|uniref:Uncharacterized protein n=1 Tax=Marmota monax TaxID=9995 RepID=A0A834PNW7_MARMO|nr:hypothetical protein GHT09_019833 [Marmota monax]
MSSVPSWGRQLGAGARPAPHGPPSLLPQGAPLSADMAESTPPASSSAAAPAPELGITAQPGPQSPPPSPPGLEEPLDGADPEVPHPDLAPVAFFCLRQTTSPRNWCIKMVCNPYPLWAWAVPPAPGPRVGTGEAGSNGRQGGSGLRLGQMRMWCLADRKVLEVASGSASALCEGLGTQIRQTLAQLLATEPSMVGGAHRDGGSCVQGS